MVKDVCINRDKLTGDCIEWKTIGDKIVPMFKEKEKKCNPKLYEEWKQKVKHNKIALFPED